MCTSSTSPTRTDTETNTLSASSFWEIACFCVSVFLICIYILFMYFFIFIHMPGFYGRCCIVFYISIHNRGRKPSYWLQQFFPVLWLFLYVLKNCKCFISRREILMFVTASSNSKKKNTKKTNKSHKWKRRKEQLTSFSPSAIAAIVGRQDLHI